MSENIFMLVYTSTATEVISEEIIGDILKSSRKLNQENLVTGFLVVRSGYFLQLLEGPEDKVRECYKRIQKDPRHRSLIVQGEAQAESRLMPEWNMGLVDLEGSGSSAECLLEIFRIGHGGKSYGNAKELQLMLKMFSKGAKLID